MQKNIISVHSYSGRELSQKHITDNNSSLAVFFPGQNYSCELPLLYYLGKTALNCSYDILMLEYGYQAARTAFNPDEVEKIIIESYDSIQRVNKNYSKLVFVSKSLGTFIAGKTAELFKGERLVHHIYLTPIRSSISLINEVRGLVIVGTGDPIFVEDDLNQIKQSNHLKILKIEKANHGLEVENLYDSLGIIREISEHGELFFKELL